MEPLNTKYSFSPIFDFGGHFSQRRPAAGVEAIPKPINWQSDNELLNLPSILKVGRFFVAQSFLGIESRLSKIS